MNTQEYPYIYKGDPFKVALWLRDTNPELTLADDDPDRGFDLSQGTVTAKVGNGSDFSVALIVEPFADQTVNKGWVYVRTANTSVWPLGKMYLQPSLTVSGQSKAADIVAFVVKQRI